MAFIWIEKTEEKQEFLWEQEKKIQSSVLAIKKKKRCRQLFRTHEKISGRHLGIITCKSGKQSMFHIQVNELSAFGSHILKSTPRYIVHLVGGALFCHCFQSSLSP